jgi:hypothetical protein
MSFVNSRPKTKNSATPLTAIMVEIYDSLVAIALLRLSATVRQSLHIAEWSVE